MILRLASRSRWRQVPRAVAALSQLSQQRASSTAASEATRAEVSPTISSKTAQKFAAITLGGVGVAALYVGLTGGLNPSDDRTTFSNWSQTHEVTPRRCFTPESQAEVESIIKKCHADGEKLRVVGSGLSPNGIAFSGYTMMSMSLMDNVISVDKDKKQVTVQAGVRIEELVEQIRAYGLTLQNFASIKEQQVGGFVQIGAHGTGARVPPVDEQVVRMKIVTPGMGTLELSKDDPDPTLFYATRVGLGCFGVVTEVTLQCIPEHKLLERTFVATTKEVRKNHAKWLKQNQHLRYMWIPYTDSVVVVQCNKLTSSNTPRSMVPEFTRLERTEVIRDLLKDRAVDDQVGGYAVDHLDELTFTELRGIAIAEAPLDYEWIRKVNEAEADFWKKSSGYTIGWSEDILGFDCGGQQWVLEITHPTGTIEKPSFADLDCVNDVMKQIEEHKVPAPAPIEQRWSSCSRSYFSPVNGTDPAELHGWLGIIYYLPTDDAKLRQKITESFYEYARRIEIDLLPKYNGAWHWAKLEIDRVDQAVIRDRLKQKYPLEVFREQKEKLDPKGILDNRITSTIFA